MKVYKAFQSTLPARGSDAPVSRYELSLVQISIHAPRKGERRSLSRRNWRLHRHFNPRSPQGGATNVPDFDENRWNISIHAPRKGERRGCTCAR